MSHLIYVHNIMATDGLATQGAMVGIWLSWHMRYQQQNYQEILQINSSIVYGMAAKLQTITAMSPMRSHLDNN